MAVNRVHELARDLGMSSKALLAITRECGLTATSASSGLSQEAVAKIRKHVAERSDVASPIRPLDLSSDDIRNAFESTFREKRRAQYEPALVRLRDALNSLLDEVVPRGDRMRFRVEPGRVKSANRLLAKAQTERYARGIASVEDIFDVVGDVVGIRVTTNTVKDAQNVFTWLRTYCADGVPDRTMEHMAGRDKDYFSMPKPSGYRALHVGMVVKVPRGPVQVPVACEVQIRTLLQNAWGELTHEDTFKPGTRLPRIVEVLSARLATALTAMDEIAQDLRDELELSNEEVAAQQLSASAISNTRAGRVQERIMPPSALPLSPRAADLPTREQLREQFERDYAVGVRLLGNVTYVRDDYALVQVPSGETGILHASSFPGHGDRYINVQEHVSEGDTVTVDVVEATATPKRIAFKLVAGDE